MSYCPDCGGTHLKLDGTVCSCTINEDTLFSDVTCVDIPEQYQGAAFRKELIPSDCGTAYQEFMQGVYDEVTGLSMRFRNMVICSPTAHSKTILAYCCIQSLFRKRVATCPVYDIMEIRKISMDLDAGRQSDSSIYQAPYLFAKVPIDTTFQVYATIATLIDRRVRKGFTTILLYNGTWEQLTYSDNRGTLVSMLGDGSYGTISAKTWRVVV